MSQSWIPTTDKVLKKIISKWLQEVNDKWREVSGLPLTSSLYKLNCLYFSWSIIRKNTFSSYRNFSFSKKLFIGGSVRECLLCSGMPVTHHVRGKDENTFMFSTGPLRIIQKIWIILCSFSSFTSWGNEKSTLGHQIKSFKFPVSSLKRLSNNKC